MSGATRSERETVRPFVGIDDTVAALDKVILHVDDDEYEPGSVVLESAHLSRSGLRLRLPEISELQDAIAKSGLKGADCGLVILAASRTHRDAVVLLRDTISKATYEADYKLKRSDADLILNDQNGFILTVAVVLLRDIVDEPLRPHLAGTWIARQVFTVSPEKEDTSFSPEVLTDAIREQFKLPKETLRYIAVDDVLGASSIGDAVHVYVEEEVLNLLLANPTEPFSVQMQMELAIQAMDIVAQTIVRDLKEEVGHSPTDTDLEAYEAPRKFFENLARTFDRSVNDVIEIASASPERLRPFWKHHPVFGPLHLLR